MELSKQELNNKLVEEDLTIEEINNVYEELKYITKIEGLEEVIEQKIKNEFKRLYNNQSLWYNITVDLYHGIGVKP